MWRIVTGLLLIVVFSFAVHGVFRGSRVEFLGAQDLELQTSGVNCGPAVLAYILKKHGLQISQEEVAARAKTDDKGTSLLGLAEVSKQLGFEVTGLRLGYEHLRAVPVPAIAVLKDHFVVLIDANPESVVVGDPLVGFVRYERRAFERVFMGQVLIIEGGKH